MVAGGSPYSDIYQASPAPNALTLVRENLGTCYACGKLNSDMVARTRLRLYVKTRNGEGKSRASTFGRTKSLSDSHIDYLQKAAGDRVADASEVEEVTSHPALDLLRHPNGPQNDGVGMSMFTLMEATQNYMEIVGRSYWWVPKKKLRNTIPALKNLAVPSQIWCMAPQYMTEWPGTGQDAMIIERYQFALGNSPSDYDPSEIVPYRFFDPSTGGYSGGLSPLRACFEQQRLARQADAMTNARVNNGGRPDAVFAPRGDEFGNSIGANEAARLENILRSRYRMAGAGAIIVSDIPGQLTPLSWPINDVIDLGRYQLTRTQIAEAYQVPITKLNRDVSNRASAESGEFAHAMDAGLPRCRRNEAALNTFYIPMWGDEASDRLFFAYDSIEGIENPELEEKRKDRAANHGAITNNELRADIRYKDRPDGNRSLAPSNFVPLLDSGPDIGTPDLRYFKGKGQEAGFAGAQIDQTAKDQQESKKKPAPAKAKPKKKKNKAIMLALKAISAQNLILDKLADLSSGHKSPVINVHAANGNGHSNGNGKSFGRVEERLSSLQIKSAGDRSHGCALVNLPEKESKMVLAETAKIDDKDLADDGREKYPHVTVRYGIHTTNSELVKAIVQDHGPVTLKLGKIIHFPANEKRDSDVVVAEVESTDLEELHHKLGDLEHTDTYNGYKPHCTLAYVKPGMGQKYESDALEGLSVVANEIIYSDHNDQKANISLLGSPRKKALDRIREAGYREDEIISSFEEEIVEL